MRALLDVKVLIALLDDARGGRFVTFDTHLPRRTVRGASRDSDVALGRDSRRHRRNGPREAGGARNGVATVGCMNRLTALAILGSTALLLVPEVALAQLAPEARCRTLAGGLVLTMKTYREVGQTRDVALEQAGLAPGSARHRVAAEAYRQLDAGTPLESVLDRARAECLRIGPDALEPDERDEDGDDGDADGDGGAGADGRVSGVTPLCADTASSIAALLADDPAARTGPIDEALLALRSSDPRDIETPQLKRLLEFGRQRARVSTNEQVLQQQVYAQCTALDAAARKALEAEYYVP